MTHDINIHHEDNHESASSYLVEEIRNLLVNSNRDLKILVKDSQTPKGLNEQGVNELKKAGFYKATNKTLNSILKRLNKV